MGALGAGSERVPCYQPLNTLPNKGSFANKLQKKEKEKS
jgi:hypothetical protein